MILYIETHLMLGLLTKTNQQLLSQNHMFMGIACLQHCAPGHGSLLHVHLLHRSLRGADAWISAACEFAGAYLPIAARTKPRSSALSICRSSLQVAV